MAGRIIYQSFTNLSLTVISASSEQETFPVRRLRDPSPAASWRSKLGWNIVAGFNDKLDFVEGVTGAAVASLVAGNYETGDLLAVMIETAINNAATDNTYTVTYSSSTHLFTIARATGSATIALPFSSGSNVATSVHIDLGFNSTDNSGATSYDGDNVAYKSREFVKLNLNTAAYASVGVALYHSLSANGTITLQGNTSDSWTLPSVSTALDTVMTGPIVGRVKFFSQDLNNWWRVVFSDVSDPVQYTELGILQISGYVEPGYDFRTPWSEEREELSKVSFADHGASYIDDKPTRHMWPLQWPALTSSEKGDFDTFFDYVKMGRPFFFAFEPTNTPAFTRYVYLSDDPKWVTVPPNYWSVQTKLSTVLA